MSSNAASNRDIENYFKFIMLYNKERAPEHKKKVDQIVQLEKSIIQRINKIKDLDDALEQGYSNTYFEDIQQEWEQKLKKDSNIEEYKSPSIKRIKIYKVSILNYFLHHRKRVRDFSTSTLSLNLKWLGYKKTLTDDAVDHWLKIYLSCREYLIKPTINVLSHGWKTLPQDTYNKIAIFWKFLSSFLSEGDSFRKGNDSSKNIKIIESFIEPFLVLYTYPNIKDKLRTALEEGNKEFNDKSKLKAALLFLDELFSNNQHLMTFINVIQAVHIIHYNKYVSLEALLYHYNVKSEIPFKEYLFPNEVQEEIQNTVRTFKSEIKDLENELFLLSFIEEKLDLVEYKGERIPNQFNFIYLYEHTSSKVSVDSLKLRKESSYLDLNPFDSLKRDVTRYLLKFLAGFLTIYSPILKDTICVTSVDKDVRVFSKEIFKNSISILETIQKEMDEFKSSGEMPEVNIDIYFKQISQKKASADKDQKIIKLVVEIVNEFFSIGFKLSQVLFNHSSIKTMTSEDLFKQYTSQDCIRDINFEPRLIPYHNELIIKNNYLEGGKVYDTLYDCCYLLLNLSFLFKQQELLVKYFQKDKLIKKIDSIVDIQSKLIGKYA